MPKMVETNVGCIGCAYHGVDGLCHSCEFPRFIDPRFGCSDWKAGEMTDAKQTKTTRRPNMAARRTQRRIEKANDRQRRKDDSARLKLRKGVTNG